MFLSDKDIEIALEQGLITIEPYNKSHLNPASYDVVLGNEFAVTDRHSTSFVDPHNKIYQQTRTIFVKDGDPFILHPGESVLGKQKEFIGVNHGHLMLLSGKSSLARAGLVVHNTAMLFNPGHYFYPTFELVNTNNVPLVLRPGMKVAQLLFARLTSETKQAYEKIGRYGKENSDHFAAEGTNRHRKSSKAKSKKK